MRGVPVNGGGLALDTATSQDSGQGVIENIPGGEGSDAASTTSGSMIAPLRSDSDNVVEK